ncbi:MAG: glycoside hydrolase family 32 protein [Saprospiraceae bacterium]|nr:glycoside hydrolase family 32 protein [Saprospiraceae bacterium]MDP4821243.1 glycoside hydrolase family 32 protein [Saprospiraceae bacterium]
MKKSLLLYSLMAILLNLSCSPEKPEVAIEAHRPAFHFSPPAKWMNDPNGMVYYEGEYHLFYQYYPDSTVWGPMHWGHAVSTDLVHWEHLPIALYPDEQGWIFSGSAVIDHNNTSGLGSPEQPPMVAIYTYHNAPREKEGYDDFQTQGIAYSLDKGRTWTKYPGNPVLPNPGIRDFRDPKVRWYAPAQKWIMALAVQDHIAFYSSPNLIEWGHESDFGQELGAHGGVWECPDLFPLAHPSEAGQKWVLLVSINPGGPNGGSATQYFIGDFDGTSFTPDQPLSTRWIDFGRDNYAGVTWSNVPETDGRTLFMGWMSNWQYAQVVPTDNWRSAMTLPRQLQLLPSAEGISLAASPAAELTALRQQTRDIPAQTLGGTLQLVEPGSPSGTLLELELELELPENPGTVIHIRRSNALGEQYTLSFDTANNGWFSDRRQAGKTDFSTEFATATSFAPRNILDNKLSLRLFFDVASVELFADGGLSNLSEIFFPREDFTGLTLEISGDPVVITRGAVHTLGQ